jgi:hypothetical protein
MIDRLSITRAGLGLNHFLLGGDRNGLRLRTDLQLDVEAARVVRADTQALLLVGLESGQLDLEVVGPREDDREIAPAIIRDGCRHGLRADVGEGDGRAGQHAATGVGDRATDTCRGRGLAEHRGTGGE